MVAIVKDNIKEIINVCERMKIQSLYLFGSAIDEKRFKKNSDIDFLFRFKKDKSESSVLEYDYFDLMFSLEKITGKKIDLVAEEKINNKFFTQGSTRKR